MEDLDLEGYTDEIEGPEEVYERQSFYVDKGQEPLRIDKFLTARTENASRNKVQKAIENKMVLVNNKFTQPNYKVKPGDHVLIYSYKENAGEEIIPEKLPLNITYEDEAILIINKAPGMVVHPGCGNYSGTLINGIAWHLQQENKSVTEDTLPRFGLVHRIDKNTSGLLVAGKTSDAVTALIKQFFKHQVFRRYQALVWGDVKEEEGTVYAHIGRHKRFRKLFDAYPEGDHGKEAITHYKVLERFGYVTLIECRLETGRTHQIRVHMQHIGHPLFNDDFYGGDRIVKGTVYSKYKQFIENCFEICPRHALHAKTLGFQHPITKEQVMFDSVLPKDMNDLIEKWRSYVTQNQIK